MRMLRLATVVATFGFGLVAIGCGPEPTAGTPMDSAKMKELADNGRPTQPGEKGTSQKGNDVAAKVTALEGEVKEKLKTLDKAIASLPDKIKAEGDANKKGPLVKVQNEANMLHSDVQKLLGGLSTVKDHAGFDDAEKKLKEAVAKLEATLKDHK